MGIPTAMDRDPEDAANGSGIGVGTAPNDPGPPRNEGAPPSGMADRNEGKMPSPPGARSGVGGASAAREPGAGIRGGGGRAGADHPHPRRGADTAGCRGGCSSHLGSQKPSGAAA